MKKGLLLIDIQNDYFPGGAWEVEGSVEAAAKAAALLGMFRESSLPVIHIQHLSTRPGATFLLPKSRGCEIHATVAPLAGEPVFRKNHPNSFRDTLLLEHLQQENITRLVIAGMMTHMCIDSTTRAAADLGFECILAHDACATRALALGDAVVPAREVQLSFVAALNGLFAKALSVEEIGLILSL